MTTADVLAAHGILRAPEVVELAHAAGLELACAAVLLEKESGGGRNVWGRDPVPTAGCYDKGGEVTEASYKAYRAALARGAAGKQGCGPTQLTLTTFQDQADTVGGCWDWRANTLVGFRILAALVRVHGARGGFRAYNGSGPAAEAYADDAMIRLTRWRALLAGQSTTEEDVPLTQQDMEALANVVWRYPVVNSEGVTVGADQVLTATEGRVKDLQDRPAPAAPVPVVGGVAVDLDALAEKVVDLLSARLAPNRAAP